MSVDPTAARRPGRPRDAGADRAILTATVHVLQENGIAGFTVDAVAARAGVGKATIYRRWPCKEDLAFDAAASVVESVETPDTGSLRGDLLAVGDFLVRSAQKSAGGRLAPELIAAAARDTQIRSLLHTFANAGRRPAVEVVRRGIERGELPEDTDVDAVVDAVAGAVFYRAFMTGAPVNAKVVARIVDIVLDGVH